MKFFNRIVVILLLAGIFVLAVFTVFYSLDIAGYQLTDLPRALGLNGFYEGLRSYVGNVESSNLIFLDIITLGIIALVGLVLFILELKPPSPRRVRMRQGTYITRRAVEDEAIEAVDQSPEVLQSSVNVKAQRRPGAKIEIRASVRPDEDVQSLQSGVRNQVRRYLAQTGIPISNIKVRIITSDPRETKTRVK
jgi:hypothetical protein